jgi:hypothetical protein
MPLHVVLPLSTALPLPIESPLYVHFLQVPLTSPFLITNEMVFVLQ